MKYSNGRPIYFYVIRSTVLSTDLCCMVLYIGTPYTQQSYKVSESFPFKWINKKWKEGFHVTSMTTAGNRWGVVMSRNAGFSDQVYYYSSQLCRILVFVNYVPSVFLEDYSFAHFCILI